MSVSGTIGVPLGATPSAVNGTVLTCVNSLQIGQIVYFNAIGSLQNINLNTYYYVVSSNQTSFSISPQINGQPINMGTTVGSPSVYVLIPSIIGNSSATVQSYTLNPSLGTSIGSGIIRQQKILFPSYTTTTDIPQYVWQWSDKNDKPVILRGTTDVLALNFNNMNISTGSLDIDIAWEEDNS